MILVQRNYLVDGIEYFLEQFSIFNSDFKFAVKNVLTLVNEKSPRAFIKDTENGHLLEIKFNGKTTESSYIMDFFDFEREFFEKAKISLAD